MADRIVLNSKSEVDLGWSEVHRRLSKLADLDSASCDGPGEGQCIGILFKEGLPGILGACIDNTF